MASVVDICNLALRQLGARRITSLSDSTEEARACNDVYESLRDDLLRSHPWNFAVYRASLASSSDSDQWEFDYSYPLPSDCLRVIAVEDDHSFIWQVEKRRIVTNQGGPLRIKYIAKETDPNQFDVSFMKCLALYIAAELAERLTNSNTKRQLAEAAFDKALRVAKFTDAQESTPHQLVNGSWLDSREYSYNKESWEI
jgi:hypothetical protein